MWKDTRLPLKKSEALLHTNDKWAKKEIREASAFKIPTNNIKYLWLTLGKNVKGLYDKNFKSLRKKLKKISGRTKLNSKKKKEASQRCYVAPPGTDMPESCW